MTLSPHNLIFIIRPFWLKTYKSLSMYLWIQFKTFISFYLKNHQILKNKIIWVQGQ